MVPEEGPAASPLGVAWADLRQAGAALVATFRSRELGPTQLAFVAFNLLEWGGGISLFVFAFQIGGAPRGRARCTGPADTGRHHRSVRLGARGSVRSTAPALARDVPARTPFGDGRYRHAAASALMARLPPRLPRGMDADPRAANVRRVAAMARAIAAGAHDELCGHGPDREHVHLPRAAPCRDRVRIRDDSIDLRARGSRS